MIFSTNREELRKTFYEAWRKHQHNLPIEPLEAQIIDVIKLHPEFHPYLNHPEKFQSKDFTHENPFLHLSLHLAVRDQITTDSPSGIKQIYFFLCEKYPDNLSVEHSMMECLERVLWEAQRSNALPNEQEYLNELRNL